MKIMIAIPCMDTVPVKFVESMMYMDKPEQTSVCFKPNSLIYDSRNLLSLTAIENDFDYIMWIDSDMVVPHDIIPKLLSDAQKFDAQIITGLYVKRMLPTAPVLFTKVDPPEVIDGHVVKKLCDCTDYPKDTVFRVEGCGFGCVLTSVSLLREVWDKFGPAFAPYTWAGEDVSFCYRVKQLGYPIWCDTAVRCGHIGTYTYTDDLFRIGGDAREEH